MPDYHRLTFRLPAELEDELAAELWERGSIGIELHTAGPQTTLDAYFASQPRSSLSDLVTAWKDRKVELISSEGVPDTDWLAVHRSVSSPFEIGRRWLIDPREPDGTAPESPLRETLRIPARRAFGTGSHESTRLILEWLEDLPVAGRRVLDLGTGSGILSLAAERLGASWVVGVDPDPVAVWVAHANQGLNRGSVRLVAGDLGCLRGRTFDLALINILPAEWLEDLPLLGRVLADRASVLLSGIPLDQGEEIVRTIERQEVTVRAARHAGEWVAFLVEVGA